MDELEELELLEELEELPCVAREAAAPRLPVPAELELVELEEPDELLALETGATLGELFWDVWLTTVLLVGIS